MPGMLDWQIKISADIKDLRNKMHEVEGELGEFEGKDHKVKLDLDTKALESTIKKLDSMLDSLSRGTGNFKQFETLSKDLSKVTSELSGFTKAFGKIDDSGTKTLLSSIQNIDKSLSDLSKHILNVNKNMNSIGGNSNNTVKQIENITKANKEAIKSTENLAKSQEKLGNITNVTSSISEKDAIKQSFNVYKKEAAEFTGEINKNKESVAQLLNELSKLNKISRLSSGKVQNLDFYKKNVGNIDLNKTFLNNTLTKLPKSGIALKDYMNRTLNGNPNQGDTKDLLKLMSYYEGESYDDTFVNAFSNLNSKVSKEKAFEISKYTNEYIEQWKDAEKQLSSIKDKIASTINQLISELDMQEMGSIDAKDLLFSGRSVFLDKGIGSSIKLNDIIKDPITSLSKSEYANNSYALTNFDLLGKQDFSSIDELKDKIKSLKSEQEKMIDSVSSENAINQIQKEINAYQHLLNIVEKIFSAQETAISNNSSNSIIQSQEKIQLELKETQEQAEKTEQAIKEIDSQSLKRNSSNSDDSLTNVKGLKHYTDEIFDSFDSDMFGQGIGENRLGKAAYFFDENDIESWKDIGGYSKYLTTWSAEQVKVLDQTTGFTEEEIDRIIKEFYSDVDEDMQEDYKFDFKNMFSDTDLYDFKSRFGVELEDVSKLLGYDAVKSSSGEYAFYNTDKLIREAQVYDQEAQKIIDVNSKVSQSIQKTSSINSSKDIIQSSTTDTNSEIQGMEQVEKASEEAVEAVEAKKEFATANKGVQSSVDSSENPLKLEAELMERVATSAREAADAKKEFVEANKQVKDSADGSNSENKKKDKYVKRRKISEEDFLNYSPSRVNEKLSNSGYTILGETVNTEFVDGLVKVSAKIKDADGAWKSFSAKVDADGNIFEQRFKTVTNGVDKLETALKNFGRETSPALTYQETLDKAQKIKNSLNLGDEYSIKVDSSEFVTITKKLTDVENTGTSVTQTFKSAQDAIDNFGKSASNSAEKTSVALKSVKGNIKEVTDESEKLANAQKEQNVNVNFNKYDKRLDSYNGKIDKYKTTIDRFNDGGWTSNAYLENVQAVENAVKEYEDLLKELKGKDASLVTSEDINKLDSYEKKIKDTITTVTNMSASEKGYNFVSGQKELDKIHKLLAENSKMSSEAKAKIRAYYAEIESGNPSMSLDRIHGEIMKIYNAEVEAGRAGKSLMDVFKTSRLHQMVAQVAGMFSVYDLVNLGKQAVSIVTDLNTQITELAKVSEQTSKQIYKDFDSYADIAQEMGGTISDTISATADWARNGYNVPDSKELAKVALLYKNVGDGIDIDKANESLISTLRGFKLEAVDAEHIIDVFNEVSNNESISSAGIGDALQRSAASFNAANTSLEKSVALVTATNSVLQNPEKAGNMWKTKFYCLYVQKCA